jgi:branched-chain amino acid transport system ATP-binding protein
MNSSWALETKNVTMKFGGLKAVDGLNLRIPNKSLMGLIGPNGAGKTTVFNLITGVYQPTKGHIEFFGESIVGLRPSQIAKKGIARTFQNIRLFRELSVLDNVLIGANKHVHYGLLAPIMQTKRFADNEKLLREEAMNLLALFDLDKKATTLANSLPYGEQRRLEIVRALATKPRLICLDEPAAGMNHQETDELMHTIAKVRKDFDLSVLLIEHDMKLVMGICENIIVLDHGCAIEEGTPEVVRHSKKVIEAYLGADQEPLLC